MVPDARVVEAVGRLIVESIGLTTVALGQAIPGLELSFPQWRALVVVGTGGGSVRVGEIAKRVGSTVPTTSRLIRRLERRGLVVTERDELDRRATLVRLSEAGERVRVGLIERRRALVRDAIELRRSTLSRELAEGLEQIADALAAYE